MRSSCFAGSTKSWICNSPNRRPGEMLFRGQMLVVKENDWMVEQCLADLANDLGGEWPGEIDASDFGAKRARDPLSANRVVIHRASSPTAAHSGPSNWWRYTNSGAVATRRSLRAEPSLTCNFIETRTLPEQCCFESFG